MSTQYWFITTEDSFNNKENKVINISVEDFSSKEQHNGLTVIFAKPSDKTAYDGYIANLSNGETSFIDKMLDDLDSDDKTSLSNSEHTQKSSPPDLDQLIKDMFNEGKLRKNSPICSSKNRLFYAFLAMNFVFAIILLIDPTVLDADPREALSYIAMVTVAAIVIRSLFSTKRQPSHDKDD